MKTDTKDNQYIDNNQYNVKLRQKHVGRHLNKCHRLISVTTSIMKTSIVKTSTETTSVMVSSQYKTSNCGNDTSGEI